MAPPTPAAKYSPPSFVSHLPAARLSDRNFTSGKTVEYSPLAIKFLTLRPNLTASSPVWVACIIFNFGLRPINHEGNKKLANSDFVCRGGIFTISRFIFPVAKSLNFCAIILWWSPCINSSQIHLTYCIKSPRASSAVDKAFCFSIKRK